MFSGADDLMSWLRWELYGFWLTSLHDLRLFDVSFCNNGCGIQIEMATYPLSMPYQLGTLVFSSRDILPYQVPP